MPTPFNAELRIREPGARSFLYLFLARALDYPTPEAWDWLADSKTTRTLRSASEAVGLPGLANELIGRLESSSYENFRSSYVSSFGHASRGPFPPNEIEYGELKADPLFQPHRLADLAAFYRAFGLELCDECDERQDHIAMELEFMAVLAMKEAYAFETSPDGEELAVCRDAEKKFLREHLGRWSPAFARRLGRAWDGEVLGVLAELLRRFVELDCASHGVRPGSEDLLLRPVDDSAERLCDSCGLANQLPGACPPVAEG
jgi:DMSO reductase family type II enzyme chaperone